MRQQYYAAAECEKSMRRLLDMRLFIAQFRAPSNGAYALCLVSFKPVESGASFSK